jgi:hypothetical protein
MICKLIMRRSYLRSHTYKPIIETQRRRETSMARKSPAIMKIIFVRPLCSL